ncbi:hypothetical protein Ancab_002541 [Ancistrocladus abbreviatus]
MVEAFRGTKCARKGWNNSHRDFDEEEWESVGAQVGMLNVELDQKVGSVSPGLRPLGQEDLNDGAHDKSRGEETDGHNKQRSENGAMESGPHCQLGLLIRETFLNKMVEAFGGTKCIREGWNNSHRDFDEEEWQRGGGQVGMLNVGLVQKSGHMTNSPGKRQMGITNNEVKMELWRVGLIVY